MKSKNLALSAISAAFVAILLTLGAYIEFIDLFAVVVSSVFVMLPLYYKSYVGGWLSCLAGGLIAFLCSGFNIMSLVFPAFFCFFGLYPLVKCKFIDKNVNMVISSIVGVLWCVVAFYGLYFYYTAVMGQIFEGVPAWIVDYLLYAVGIVSVGFYFIYDFYIVAARKIIDKYIGKILK